MFAAVPCYFLPGTTSQDHIINLDNLEDVKPHDDVPVNPVEGNQNLTNCCEATFASGTTIIILLDVNTMKSRLQALTGTVNEFGQLL